MVDQAANAEARAALFDFQRYLSDQVAPLMVADSVAILLRYSPQLILAEIQGWTASQYRGRGAAVPLSDFLYHAVKKVHLMGEFNLVPGPKLEKYLEELKEMILEVCPAEDRELLKQNFALLGAATATASSQVDILHRQAGSEARLASSLTREGVTGSLAITGQAAQGLERFALILERMGHEGQGTPPDMRARTDLESQMISMAALGSQTGEDFRQLLERLQERGLDTSSDRIFRALSSTLPTWAVPAPREGAAATTNMDFDSANPLEAMHKIISMAEDPEEGARRFREMLDAAIEQFNAGHLARAVTMFDLAERIIAEKRVEDSIVTGIRANANQKLDPEQLRQSVEKKEKHFLLRRMFNFFTKLTPAGLLTELQHEEKRERRRSLLAFLEVHGPAARNSAIERIAALPAMDSTETAYFARNLLYVINHIARTGEDPVDKEIDILSGFTTLLNPAFVIKEALTALGQIRSERAEKVLIGRLHEMEGHLIRGAESKKSNPQEIRQLLDRVIASLVRQSSGPAIRAIVDHGLKTNEQLGDTRARLGALNAIDLGEFPESLGRLVAAVRAELPVKVLGFVAQKKQPHVVALIDAFAASPSPSVRELLDEIVRKFPDRDFTEKSTAVLSGFGAAPGRGTLSGVPIPPSLVGDLELFGLPNLLQSLAESQVSGVLTLTDSEGRNTASLGLELGKVARCHSRLLRGKEALFQLFETPLPGNFAFYAGRDVGPDREFVPPLDVAPLIFEAMRRHDELRRARLLVPETMALKATGTKPAPLPSESDAKLVREVWLKAASGAKPGDWEKQISADSYRIWRLLAHWVETGALEVVSPT